MKEQYQKEQYQSELNQIRAPKELIEKTKIAMKKAEKEINEDETGVVSVKSFTQKNVKKIALVAAAAVVLVVGAVSVNALNSDNKIVDKPIQLGTQEQQGPDVIENNQNEQEMTFGELTIQKTDKAENEIMGKDVVSQEINGIEVTFSMNIISGYCQCILENEGQKYLISSKLTDMETFVKEVESYLSQVE